MMLIAKVIPLLLTGGQAMRPAEYIASNRNQIETDVSSEKSKKNSKDLTCVICHEGLASDELLVTALACAHVYHDKCIHTFTVQSHLRVRNNCPICRMEDPNNKRNPEYIEYQRKLELLDLHW